MRIKDLLIYDVIGQDWWTGEGITAKQFQKDFAAAQKDSDLINIRINSPGGSLFDGVAIYNTIAQSTVETHTYIDGIAYSMAAIIALAGKKVFAAKNSTILLHNVSGGIYGNARDIRSGLEMIDKLDGSLIISIAEKTGLTDAEVKSKWMNYDDHTLSAQEAKDAKLVDEITTIEADTKVASLNEKEAFAYFVAKHGGKSETLLAKVKSFISDSLRGLAPNNNSTPQNSTDMKFEKTLLALKNGASAEDRLAAIAEVEAFTGVNEKFSKAEVDASVAAAVKAANDTTAAELKKAQEDLVAEKAAHETLKNGAAGKGKNPVQDGLDNNGVAAEGDKYLTEADKEARAMVAKMKPLAVKQ